MAKFNIKKITGPVTSTVEGRINIRNSSVVGIRGNLTVRGPNGDVKHSGYPWEFYNRDDLRHQQTCGAGHPYNLMNHNGTFVVQSDRGKVYYCTNHTKTIQYPTSMADDIRVVGGATVDTSLQADSFKHALHYYTDEQRLESEYLFATMGRGCTFSPLTEWKHWLESEGTFVRTESNARYGQAFWIPTITAPAVLTTPPVNMPDDPYHLVTMVQTAENESGPYYSFAIWIRVVTGKVLVYSNNIGATEAHYSDPMAPHIIESNPDRYTYVSGSAESDTGYRIPPIRLYATPGTVFKIALPFIGIGRYIMMPWNHQVPVQSADKLKLF